MSISRVLKNKKIENGRAVFDLEVLARSNTYLHEMAHNIGTVSSHGQWLRYDPKLPQKRIRKTNDRLKLEISNFLVNIDNA